MSSFPSSNNQLFVMQLGPQQSQVFATPQLMSQGTFTAQSSIHSVQPYSFASTTQMHPYPCSPPLPGGLPFSPFGNVFSILPPANHFTPVISAVQGQMSDQFPLVSITFNANVIVSQSSSSSSSSQVSLPDFAPLQPSGLLESQFRLLAQDREANNRHLQSMITINKETTSSLLPGVTVVKCETVDLCSDDEVEAAEKARRSRFAARRCVKSRSKAISASFDRSSSGCSSMSSEEDGGRILRSLPHRQSSGGKEEQKPDKKGITKAPSTIVKKTNTLLVKKTCTPLVKKTSTLVKKTSTPLMKKAGALVKKEMSSKNEELVCGLPLRVARRLVELIRRKPAIWKLKPNKASACDAWSGITRQFPQYQANVLRRGFWKAIRGSYIAAVRKSAQPIPSTRFGGLNLRFLDEIARNGRDGRTKMWTKRKVPTRGKSPMLKRDKTMEIGEEEEDEIETKANYLSGEEYLKSIADAAIADAKAQENEEVDDTLEIEEEPLTTPKEEKDPM